MGRVVIVCYRPKPGCGEALRRLMVDHVNRLRSAGLVTDRAPITMEAKDGTFVEVFEWKSAQAIEAAHSNPTVLQMWQEYGAVCDYVPIGSVNEASQLFSEFAPVATRAARRPRKAPSKRRGRPARKRPQGKRPVSRRRSTARR